MIQNMINRKTVCVWLEDETRYLSAAESLRTKSLIKTPEFHAGSRFLIFLDKATQALSVLRLKRVKAIGKFWNVSF